MMRKKYELSSKNDEIKEFLDEQDITYKHPAYGIYCIINGVKTEWNTGDNCLVIGKGAQLITGRVDDVSDNRRLRDLIEEYFGNDTVIKPRTYSMSRFCEYATVEDFTNLVDLMLNLPFEINQKEDPIIKKVQLKTSDYFMNTAKLIKFAVDNDYPLPLNRGDLGLDEVDKIIRIGYSEAAAERIK